MGLYFVWILKLLSFHCQVFLSLRNEGFFKPAEILILFFQI